MIHNGFHVAVRKSPAVFGSQAKTAGSIEQTGPAHGCIVNRQKTENVSFYPVELIEQQTRVSGGHDEGAMKTKFLILAACGRHPEPGGLLAKQPPGRGRLKETSKNAVHGIFLHGKVKNAVFASLHFQSLAVI
jgi:hypothetical protein